MRSLLLCCVVCWALIMQAGLIYGQIDYTANDQIPGYNTPFSYGSGMGSYSGWGFDETAALATGIQSEDLRGVGVKTLRMALYEFFLEQYGYDIRLPNYETISQNGGQDFTVFVGYPSEAHRDNTKYCSSAGESKLFKNMYLPIWDNGANGTPVNDDNYYALYLYKMVSRYKGYVKFWEIWNEPDYDSGANGWKPSGVEGNWWDNDPDPCALPSLNAPLYHYIRLLHISYEVIKYVDSKAFVAIGGIGSGGFLDAVLRNTDNPDDGKVTNAYPLKGGAYFDVLSYHSYPHSDGSLRTWNADVQEFVFERHSDAAAESVVNKYEMFEEVLSNYGYGRQYPKKKVIITECNIPKKAFGEYIGGKKVQRNFMMKALVLTQKARISQFYVYNLSDEKNYESTDRPHDLMGLYLNVNAQEPFNQTTDDLGITYKTTSDLLYGYVYDKARTEAMNMPEDVNGAAFKANDGKFRYVLWARTTADRVDYATAKYSFPSSFGLNHLNYMKWNYSSTGKMFETSSTNIELSETPIILDNLVDDNKTGQLNILDTLPFNVFPNPVVDKLNIVIDDNKEEFRSITLLDIDGRKGVVKSQELQLNAGVISMDVSDLQQGWYVLSLESYKNKYFTKVYLK